MSNDVAGYVERAIAWALEHLGSADYRLKCLGFVEDAYELGNGIVLAGYGYAGEAAERYGAADDGSAPPRGAFAFYECSGSIAGEYRDWGHVGLSLGDGRVVHAWGAVRLDHYLDVSSLPGAPGWTSPRYLGWAGVARVLEGMTRLEGGGGESGR